MSKCSCLPLKPRFREVLMIDPTAQNELSNAAARIYGIRCHIVHTKSASTDPDPILPNSDAIEHFPFDIDLIEFIALETRKQNEARTRK